MFGTMFLSSLSDWMRFESLFSDKVLLWSSPLVDEIKHKANEITSETLINFIFVEVDK